jgi:hypothetical protein
MKITINNLLTESLIDDIPSFTKMDKAVLKFLHANQPVGDSLYWENIDSYHIWDLMKTFGLTDGNYIFKMWKIYKDYNNILFDDLSTIGNYTSNDYDKAADVIIMNYYVNNVVGKMVYPGWQVGLMEPIDIMLSEDMITMEIKHVDYPPTIFINLELSDMSRRQDISVELLSMDEDNLGEHMEGIGMSKQLDMLGISSRMIEPPVNLSDKALKNYFGEILDAAHDFIEEYDEEINEYYNENRPDGGWRWEQ